MDHRELQYFARLYETRNVTKAADDLHLVRQSLSGSIAKLEKEIGAPLFTRSRSGVEPTPGADALYRLAQKEQIEYRKLMQEYEAIAADIRGETRRREVSFGACWELLPSSLIESICRLQYRKDSKIHIQFGNVTACSGWHDVRDCMIDVVLTRKLPPLREPGLEWVLASPNQACAIVSASDSLAKNDEIDFFKQLDGRDYLCPYDEVIDEIELYLRKSATNVRQVPANYTIIGCTILEENAVCVLPYGAARRVADHFDGLLRCIPCPNYPLVTDGFLVYRSDASAHVRSFVSQVRPLIANALVG